MTQLEIDRKLVRECEKPRPDLGEIKALILAGGNTNQTNQHNESIFSDVFTGILHGLWDDIPLLRKTVEQIKDIIQTMVASGWDTKRFGLSVMLQFIFSTYDRFTFELFRFMLQYELADDPKAYESSLESIGIEESYQRCCENDHELENLFYAIYEMIAAKMDGRNYESIGLYYDAEGLRIDNIIYFSASDTTEIRDSFTEFNADIGFVCGSKLLILREGINILLMNDRRFESPQIEIPSLFGEKVIGCTITHISFSHKNVTKGTAQYGQPTILLALDNGKTLKFSHNFGELPDNQAQSRFWVE